MTKAEEVTITIEKRTLNALFECPIDSGALRSTIEFIKSGQSPDDDGYNLHPYQDGEEIRNSCGYGSEVVIRNGYFRVSTAGGHWIEWNDGFWSVGVLESENQRADSHINSRVAKCKSRLDGLMICPDYIGLLKELDGYDRFRKSYSGTRLWTVAGKKFPRAVKAHKEESKLAC